MLNHAQIGRSIANVSYNLKPKNNYNNLLLMQRPATHDLV